MDFRLKPACTIVAGTSGSGKTTFALRHMINADGVACRFVFDYKPEFSVRLSLSSAYTARELESALATRWVIFNPHRMFPGRVDAAFLFFCDWVKSVAKRGRGRKLLYVDEAWKYCDPHRIPLPLAECVQNGRMDGLETMFMSQRPNRLNGAILNEVTEFVCFRLQGRTAIQTAIEAGIPDKVPGTLLKGQFYSLNCDTGGVRTGRVF